MFIPLLMILTVGPPLPKECEQPQLREVAPLKDLANLDGAFSAGLDAVATWCFESGGTWNAGILGRQKKPIPIDAPPTGDCLKAIASCEGTFETVKNKAPLRDLAATALADFDRPYRGTRYQPKRSGLKETPSQGADCRSKSRTELFQMAQHRMDLARLTSQIQNEYANYKTWLFTRGLECRNEVLANHKDPTNSGVSIDQSAKVEPVLPTPKDPELAAAVRAPMIDRWKYFSKLQAKAEADRDFTLGFLASRELRGCDCARVNPAAVVRVLEKKEGGEAGASLLASDDPANTRCAVCMFEVFPLWSARAQRQCASLDSFSDAELARLEKSDDINGLPPRCLEDTRARRAEQERLAADAVRAKAAADARAIAEARMAAQLKTMVGGRDGGVLVAMANPSGGANPTRTTPVGANPVGANPVGANPVGANPVGANPVGASPVGANPVGANPVGATPVGANPTGANPTGANPVGATPTGANPVGANPVGVSPVGATPVGANPVGATPNLTTVDGYTYYRGPAPAAAVGATAAVGGSTTNPATASGLGGAGTPSGPGTEEFTPPSSWAPIPQREDGRIYVRLFMSRACVADVNPGPLQARTGDLLLLPYEAKFLQVKSPCGGLAEVYFGREARPRVSENFGRAGGLKFEFKRQ